MAIYQHASTEATRQEKGVVAGRERGSRPRFSTPMVWPCSREKVLATKSGEARQVASVSCPDLVAGTFPARQRHPPASAQKPATLPLSVERRPSRRLRRPRNAHQLPTAPMASRASWLGSGTTLIAKALFVATLVVQLTPVSLYWRKVLYANPAEAVGWCCSRRYRPT